MGYFYHNYVYLMSFLMHEIFFMMRIILIIISFEPSKQQIFGRDEPVPFNFKFWAYRPIKLQILNLHTKHFIKKHTQFKYSLDW